MQPTSPREPGNQPGNQPPLPKVSDIRQSVSSIEEVDSVNAQLGFQPRQRAFLQGIPAQGSDSSGSIGLVSQKGAVFSSGIVKSGHGSIFTLGSGSDSSFFPILPSSVLQSFVSFDWPEGGHMGLDRLWSFDELKTYEEAQSILAADVERICAADPKSKESFTALTVLRARQIPGHLRACFLMSKVGGESFLMTLARRNVSVWMEPLIDALLTQPVNGEQSLHAGQRAALSRVMSDEVKRAVSQIANDCVLPGTTWTEREPTVTALTRVVEALRRVQDQVPPPSLHTLLSPEQSARVWQALTPTKVEDFSACFMATKRWGFDDRDRSGWFGLLKKSA